MRADGRDEYFRAYRKRNRNRLRLAEARRRRRKKELFDAMTQMLTRR